MTHAFARPRTLALGAGLAVLALGGAIGLSAHGAGAATTKPPATPKPNAGAGGRVVVLGASNQTAEPACPADPCKAEGNVTGFQTKLGAAKQPFVAPANGLIVAWSIKLSMPTAKQKGFFDQFFGGGPSARIAVLKPLKGRKAAYRLKAQGPVEQLDSVLGQTTTFTLKNPLPVRAGQTVALSLPTWAPAFAVGLPKDNTWRGSRRATQCGTSGSADSINAQIKGGRPQVTQGTNRVYGCGYNQARLLYSATLLKG
jgi:hypothetical protein